MKKLFLSITALAIVIFLSLGCVTKQVWKDKVRAEPYNERIISFYNNREEEKIIFIGEKYHYIFDKGTNAFSKFLEAKKLLKLKENHLYINANTDREDKQQMYATLSFGFKKENLNQEQKDWLEKYNGFYVNTTPMQHTPYYSTVALPIQADTHPYMVSYQLSGKRYQSNSQVNNQVVKLDKPIDIEVVEFNITDKKSTLYKIAMTPLSVTADAGLAIAGAVILPIMWIVKPRSRPKSLR